VVIDALATHNPAFSLPIAPQPFTSPVIVQAPVVAGQQPVLKDADSRSSVMYYIVRKGDTLFNIAKRFGVSVDLIRQWNKLSGVDIRLGQQLMIKK
jgi:membrane-bound lytic murein transglycosylase D